jgi:hypothetical protein
VGVKEKQKVKMIIFDKQNASKNPQKRNKMKLKTIISDIEIIKEAVKNGDKRDALQMLNDLKEDLKLLELIG